MIEVNVSDSLTREQIRKLSKFMGDFTAPLKDMGIYALRSIDLNYQQQGRPNHWQQSNAAKKRNGMTLVETGRLRRSTQVSADGNIQSADKSYNLTKTQIKIGTEVPYYYNVYKNKENSLHARYPAIILQEEDIPIFQNIMIRHIDNL